MIYIIGVLHVVSVRLESQEDQREGTVAAHSSWISNANGGSGYCRPTTLKYYWQFISSGCGRLFYQMFGSVGHS